MYSYPSQQVNAAVNKQKLPCTSPNDETSRQFVTLEFIERACRGADPVPDAELITEVLSSTTALSEEAIKLFVECRMAKTEAHTAVIPQVQFFNLIHFS